MNLDAVPSPPSWRSLLPRGLLGLALGAALGGAVLLAVYSAHPGFAVEMDRDIPRFLKGLYDVERAGDETFAWSGPAATMTLRGLDRRREWTCTVRLRGARADVSTLPEVVATVDGLIASTVKTANAYQDVAVVLPPKAGAASSVVQLTASNTFVPGPGDARNLGVVIDRWACEPAAPGILWPPMSSVVAGVLGGALFGGLFALFGASTGVLVAGVLVVSIAQAVPLTWEFGAFTDYPDRATTLAASVVLGTLLLWSTTRLAGAPFSVAANVVVAGTAGVLYLKLLALTHPSKLPIYIVFHAHRLEWVLDGRFFFTQVMPSGVRFPYAIGLYLFAAPWSLVTTDHVLILRSVVASAEAVGALLMYVLIARVWRDPAAAVAGAFLFQLVPRTFNIQHNANMTNAFGQSVAFAALVAAILLPLRPGRPLDTLILALLTAWALLSHVSTFSTLVAILAVLALFYRYAAETDQKDARAASNRVFVAVIVATILAVVLYYGWFGEAYRSALRMRAAAPVAETAPAGGSAAAGGESVWRRIVEAGDLTVLATGWPLLLLGAVGAVALPRGRWRDRLSLGVIALVSVYALFVTSVVLMPVDQSFRRYAAEFISRVTLATYPAVVILAARGTSWLWTAGTAGRIAVVVLLAAALNVGVMNWIDWLR